VRTHLVKPAPAGFLFGSGLLLVVVAGLPGCYNEVDPALLTGGGVVASGGWLGPHTCEKIETFLPKVSVPLQNYADDFSERGYPRTSEGRALGIRILQEIQPLRRELISEFRAILYPPPWYEAPLRWLEWLETRVVRKDRSQE
jgi:hypothetical protein